MTKYSEEQLMKKINKEFDEKCIKLRNRIQRLKKEEENYKIKMNNFRKKMISDRQIKHEKQNLKLEMQKIRAEQDREMSKKRKKIQVMRQRSIIKREEKKNENLSKKKIQYRMSMNDKNMLKYIREQLLTQQLNKNTYKHAKIKQQYNQYGANKAKYNLHKEIQQQKEHENNILLLKELEKEMKNTCNKLEVIEKKYLEKLNETKTLNSKLMESSSVKQFNTTKSRIKIKSKNNFCKTSHNNLKINRSMDILSSNEMECENSGFDWDSANKSVRSNKKSLRKNQVHSQKQLMVNRKERPKSKYHRSANSFIKSKTAKNMSNKSKKKRLNSSMDINKNAIEI